MGQGRNDFLWNVAIALVTCAALWCLTHGILGPNPHTIAATLRPYVKGHPGWALFVEALDSRDFAPSTIEPAILVFLRAYGSAALTYLAPFGSWLLLVLRLYFGKLTLLMLSPAAMFCSLTGSKANVLGVAATCAKCFIIFIIVILVRVTIPKYKLESLSKLGWLYPLVVLAFVVFLYIVITLIVG